MKTLFQVGAAHPIGEVSDIQFLTHSSISSDQGSRPVDHFSGRIRMADRAAQWVEKRERQANQIPKDLRHALVRFPTVLNIIDSYQSE